MTTQPQLPPLPPESDVESATDAYATRFAGATGAWMLAVQYQGVQAGLAGFNPDHVLDVGGAHAQVAAPLARVGKRVTVTGSSPACEALLRSRLTEPTVAFVLASSLQLPFADRAFPVCLALRMLTHSPDWQTLVAELCRVADQAVIVDYPTRNSLNRVAGLMFGWKKHVEKNTRTFRLFDDREMARAFARAGFRVHRRDRQFFWPMVLHRMLRHRGASRLLEAMAAALGLRRCFGSPVILTAVRESFAKRENR